MICTRCLESNPQLIYQGVCRRCLSYPSFLENDKTLSRSEPIALALTKQQQVISDRLLQSYKQQSVFIYAVCGAGKTEICLAMVKECLESGVRIGWAIPRREVVLELHQRLQTYFPKYTITPVCQGYTNETTGDLIVCTMHQLYRYHGAFDVLIVDEPDAFPYQGNRVLENLVHLSCVGSFIYLSATYSLSHMLRLSLPLRPSEVLLPLPQVSCGYALFLRFIIDFLPVRRDPCLLFVPTRSMAVKLARFMHCPFITSESEAKDKILDTFRLKGGLLVCTTVLERGVTFKDCFVFVLHADHPVFSESSLVQIAGRALRGMTPRKGFVKFYCSEHRESIRGCCRRIQKANDAALIVLNQS